MKQTHHQIDYIEFQGTDLEALKTFYGNAFGWSFVDYGPDYVEFNDGALTGGFAKGEQIAAGALVILYSDNLEQSLETVKTNGATVVKEIFSFPGGRRFHFTDPAGNELAIWSDK